MFVLNSLTVKDIENVLQRAINHPHGFPDLTIECEPGVLNMIAQFANGDARVALNTLEMAVLKQ